MIYVDNNQETLRVYFLRHGETDWNRRGLYQGQKDIPLNERGRQQAQMVGEKLVGRFFDHIYTSDLLRARETTQIIRPHIGAQSVSVLKSLRELDFGRWEGLSFTEVKVAYPREVKDIFAKPHSFEAPGGESVATLRARVIKAWKGILEENRAASILVVSHGGPIRVLWGHWLGGEKALWNIPFPHCAPGFASFNSGGGFPRIFIPRI